jgi:hypothetical protein
MTVGIVLTNNNRTRGVVVADARVSNGGMVANNAQKIVRYEHTEPKFSGVVIGTGRGDYIKSMYARFASPLNYKDPKDLVTSLLADIQTQYAASRSEFFERERKMMLLDMNALDPAFLADTLNPEVLANLKKEYEGELHRRFHNMRQTADELISDGTEFRIVSTCDGKISNYGINRKHVGLFDYNIDAIGSGASAAIFGLNQSLQGTESTDLALDNLLYHALIGYNSSATSSGVGGIPQIAILDEDGTALIPQKTSILLGNLMGAHSAQLYGALTRKGTKDLVAQVLEDDKNTTGEIAKILGMSKKNVTTLYIPPESWQTKSNLE